MDENMLAAMAVDVVKMTTDTLTDEELAYLLRYAALGGIVDPETCSFWEKVAPLFIGQDAYGMPYMPERAKVAIMKVAAQRLGIR